MFNRGCLVTGAGRGLGASSPLTCWRKVLRLLLCLGNKLSSISSDVEHLDRALDTNLFLEVGSTLDAKSTLNAICQLNNHGCDLNLLIAMHLSLVLGMFSLSVRYKNGKIPVSTNVFGLARCIRAAIPALRKASNAQIIVIGSAIGHTHSSHATAYAVSKAMSWSLVKCLSAELAPFGIAVNEWIPGPLLTAMNPAAATQPVCRQPDDKLILDFFRYISQMQSPMPSGQSFSLRPQP